MAEPTPDLQSIHSRVLQHADKLFAALVDLEAAGGMGKLAAGLKPKSTTALADVLKSTKTAIEEQLAELKKAKTIRRPPPSGDR